MSLLLLNFLVYRGEIEASGFSTLNASACLVARISPYSYPVFTC